MKMKIMIVTGIIVAICCICCICCAEQNGSWGNLIWNLDDSGTLTISGTGEMNDFDMYTSTSRAWQPYKDQIVHVIINEGVLSVGSRAFSECGNLESVVLPDGLLYINERAFELCKSLKTINIPKGVDYIGVFAFYHCEILPSINIPDSVTTIDYGAFSDCFTLQSVFIPQSVSCMGISVFSFCKNLRNIDVDKRNEFYCSINGVLYTKDRQTVCEYPIGKTAKEYCIPDTVTHVQQQCFWDSRFTTIYLPASLEYIGTTAFQCAVTDVYYYGTEQMRDNIYIEDMNHALVEANWHYISPGEPTGFIKSFVTRCYQIILGRDADESGLNNWAIALSSGEKNASEIIDGFVNSNEFKSKGYNSEESVRILYRAMLGREPDPAGLASWKAVLDQGYPFASVINGFCRSAEFCDICDEYGIIPGSVNVDPVQPIQPTADMNKIKAFVTRCYEIILSRGADPEGLNAWAQALATGEAQASQIIDGFVNSPEFLNKNLSKEEQVDTLYKAMLGRGADPEGKAAWVKVLADGNPFGVVINGFCGSIEFGNICAEYGIQPGSVAVKGVMLKRVAITPEGDEPEAPVVYKGYNSEYINEEKVRAFVKHCYESVLGREGDAEGVEAYAALILNGKKTPKRVAYEFVFSPEFQGKLPGNEAFIRILYKLYLNREPSAEELAGWVAMLEGGTGLVEIVKGFADSAEFKAIVNSMKN